MTRRSIASLVLFVGIVAAVAVTASQFQPGAWYETLAKPPWNPPNWLFGPVWTLLYIGIAVAGWRIWASMASGSARGLWIAQLVLNGLWSILFFGQHLIVLALIDILLLVVVLVLLIRAAWHPARIAAWLLTPYLLWVSFASSLNAAIWWLNR